MQDSRIDAGKAFDWGRTGEDYARYRDIYPQEFYDRILARGLCVRGQKVLDLGTGTGVLPRNMAKYGAEWIGTDMAENQIEQAKRLAGDLPMEFLTVPAEQVDFPDGTFDVITACQCFWYFDHERMAKNLARMLKKNGRLLVLYMAWLPFEDAIAAQSEKLVLQYSPDWTGAGETQKPIEIPDAVRAYFTRTYHEEYRLRVPFTRETWHGRMRACRGVGASLCAEELAQWDREHRALLQSIAPEHFEVLHYAAMAELKVK
ncbi:MAG: class I SAM-dependent methyltransferase [Acutalibacteraceae bacterium]